MKVKELPAHMNVNELRRRNIHFTFCIINNQKCILIGKEHIISNLPNKFSITIEEKVRNSITKQAIQMQMGRTPQRYREEIRTYYATQLNTPCAGIYKTYEIV